MIDNLIPKSNEMQYIHISLCLSLSLF